MPYENYKTHGVYEDIEEHDRFFEGKSRVSRRRSELNLKVRAGICHVEEGERRSMLTKSYEGAWGLGELFSLLTS